ncbi:MAG: hypothetical protein O7A08_10600 [SAR324 cluster bacterium]|nr:hypothetical protein [SAR324 cluster bacterium]MCZ6557663.1 hypothetical protein [SAR324 cluster bacterium]MCZ6842120.1 hypothetical protein [SAR324 cluster bacterium]
MSHLEVPPLPDPLTLPALQDYIRRVVQVRNFTTELDKILILLVEEVGELATEISHMANSQERFDPQNLAYELIDILLYLLDFANGFSLDVLRLWEAHPPPESVPAPLPPDLTLNGLAGLAAGQALPPDGGGEERLLVLLCEGIGELAHGLRKHWKGRAEAEQIGRSIITVLHCLFRLGARIGVDFEAALTEKERQNARRRWDY